MADGRLGRANAGHHKRVERELSSAKASGAHHDFNRAKSSSGEGRSDAGHGSVFAAALWPELERNGSVEGAGRLELALGGAIGGGAQGGAAGVLKWLGKETGEANLGGAGSSSASSGKKKKERVGR